MNSIAATPKMFSITYYILPISHGHSNTYHYTEVAYTEDEAKQNFLKRNGDNYRIQSISEIKRK